MTRISHQKFSQRNQLSFDSALDNSCAFKWFKVKMATVNLKFNQLLLNVQTRVQGESKGFSTIIKKVPITKTIPAPSMGENKGLSITKVTSAPSERATESTSKTAEQVVFSLKDFIENKKAREEEAKEEQKKVDDDVEDVDVKEEEAAEKATGDSSDESVIDDDESMMMQDDDDSDLEVIKSDEPEKKEEKVSGKDLGDSDIENEIIKLHDIIGELSKPDEKESDSKDEEIKIVEEKTETILPSEAESQPEKEPIVVEDTEMLKPGKEEEKVGLGKFSGLSIKKNLKDEESESEKKPDDGYEWQKMDKEEKTDEREEKEEVEVKLEETPIVWSVPKPSPPIVGLPPGLKVEIKEVQGSSRWEFPFLIFFFVCFVLLASKFTVSSSRFATKRKAAESPSRRGSKKLNQENQTQAGPQSDKPSINIEELIAEEKLEASVKRDETPILVGDESPEKNPEVTLEETAVKEDVFEDEDEEVTEFDLCTHGDLVNDYLCYECTYNRWRVGWNKRVPEEKRKSRPEFLELSHKLNIGSLRNISIQRAKPVQPKPEKPAEEKKEKADEAKTSEAETKPETEKKPDTGLNNGKTEDPPKNMKTSASDQKKENSSFKLPPGVNLSNSGGFKKTGATFSRLPSGISFTSSKQTTSSNIPPTPGSSSPTPPPPSQETPSSSVPDSAPPTSEASAPPPTNNAASNIGEKAVDPLSLIAGIDWSQILKLTSGGISSPSTT